MNSPGDPRRFVTSAATTVVLGLAAMAATAVLSEGVRAVPAAAARAAALRAATSTAGESATSRFTIGARGPAALPFGAGPIFPGHVLVAYYGTAGTGSLGVLGEDTPDRITARLRKAAAPFGRRTAKVQIVYELIATVADASPGADGDFSHDVPRPYVRAFIRAAHRNNALLVLDLQPGRASFLDVAKRWAWALHDPWVGLALDPEWRMGPGQVPARVIGSVRAREVNAVSRWLRGLQVNRNLPEKIFMLHTFRTTMIQNIQKVVRRKGLAMIEHVDGFGTRQQKLATYHAVAKPEQFHMGFKLFYDEDVDRMSAARVKRIRPVVEFVSFQ